MTNRALAAVVSLLCAVAAARLIWPSRRPSVVASDGGSSFSRIASQGQRTAFVLRRPDCRRCDAWQRILGAEARRAKWAVAIVEFEIGGAAPRPVRGPAIIEGPADTIVPVPATASDIAFADVAGITQLPAVIIGDKVLRQARDSAALVRWIRQSFHR